MEIKTIGVIGAGQMGAGIAQIAAASGLKVVMNDIAKEFVDKGFSVIESNLSRMVKKEKISAEEKSNIISQIKGSLDISDIPMIWLLNSIRHQWRQMIFLALLSTGFLCP